MMTELGKVTHRYWYDGDLYFRQPLAGGDIEVWAVTGWANLSRKAS